MCNVSVMCTVFFRDNYIVSLSTWALTHVQQLSQTRLSTCVKWHAKVWENEREGVKDLMLPLSLLLGLQRVIFKCNVSFVTFMNAVSSYKCGNSARGQWAAFKPRLIPHQLLPSLSLGTAEVTFASAKDFLTLAENQLFFTHLWLFWQWMKQFDFC